MLGGVSKNEVIMFDNNVALYFYSAVLQANTALIAFAAVFVVFKFQLMSQALQNKDSEIIQFIDNYFSSVPEEIRFYYNNISIIFNQINSRIADPTYQPQYRKKVESLIANPRASRLMQERKQIVDRQILLKNNFRWPMLSILPVIIICLCLLPFSYNLHLYYSNYELPLIAFVIVLNVWALILNVVFVFKTISE